MVCGHEKIVVERIERISVHYRKNEKGVYSEHKDELIKSDIENIRCSICGKELEEKDVDF
ncbi:MAG: hypothetical protein ACTSWX_06510 [Promethearchaeota archaeon]